MRTASLDSRSHDHSIEKGIVVDSVAAFTHDPSSLPTVPPPTARLPSSNLAWHHSSSGFSDTGFYDGLRNYEEDDESLPYKTASMSTGQSTLIPEQASKRDAEKSSPSRSSDRLYKANLSGDVEKGTRSPHRKSRAPDRSAKMPNVLYMPDHDSRDIRMLQESKACMILLFFSLPCAVLSILNAIWTIISLFITLLTQPVRLCARRPSFGQQLGGLIGPALNLQLKCIYTPLSPHANEDCSYHTLRLLMVQLLSPFLSFGMMIAAAIVAVYWLSSAIVGDPVGTDKRDDCRESVLLLRQWWETWLIRSIRED